MAEGSNPPRPDVAGTSPLPGQVLDEPRLDGAQGDGAGTNGHTHGGDVRAAASIAREKVVTGAAEVGRLVGDVAKSPQVAAAAEKTRDAAGKAVGTVREKVGHSPHVTAATEKTRVVADRAAGAVREQAEHHPKVASTAERTAASSGKAARAAGQQAKAHPRAASGLAAVGVALLAVRRKLRRRRSEKA